MNKKITLNKDGTPRRKGSGRKRGSTSFVNITMTELKKYIGENTPIQVSRVWLENLGIGLQQEAPKPVAEVKEAQEEPEQKISFNLTTFDNEQ